MTQSSLPQRLSQARVLVVGDTMLDRYWFGDVERISPEAPVPVVRVTREEVRLGGAANVARNARALGAQVSFLSVVGEDAPAQELQSLLRAAGISDHLHRDASLQTTVKLRVIGRQQQLIRIDFETPPSHEVLQGALGTFKALLQDHDAVVLSDYGKGGLTHVAAMVQAARAAGKPVLVDPKGDNYAKYAGATVITPNRSEFRQVAGAWKGEVELLSKARVLRDSLQLGALLVTRSEEGMSLVDDEPTPLHVRAEAHEVFDVTGAGDTVIATLGALLAAGESLRQAVPVANRAGGIVVGKLGTAVVTQEELFGRAAKADVNADTNADVNADTNATASAGHAGETP
jgi:D-glycero-beta-D-manno-heptose-7-phosphate kinase